MAKTLEECLEEIKELENQVKGLENNISKKDDRISDLEDELQEWEEKTTVELSDHSQNTYIGKLAEICVKLSYDFDGNPHDLEKQLIDLGFLKNH